METKNLMRRKRIQLEFMREYDTAVVELKQKVGGWDSILCTGCVDISHPAASHTHLFPASPARFYDVPSPVFLSSSLHVDTIIIASANITSPSPPTPSPNHPLPPHNTRPSQVRELEGQDMRETIQDRINAWFVANRNPETGEYPDFPDADDGGSKVGGGGGGRGVGMHGCMPHMWNGGAVTGYRRAGGAMWKMRGGM
jgi:hypothetical protein